MEKAEINGTESDTIFIDSSTSDTTRKRSGWGLVAVVATGSLAAGLTIVTYPFISPAFRKICLPYVPATSRQIENIFKLCKSSKGTLVDLGSGDGRVVITAARNGFIATGVELNPWLVAFSKVKALFLGLSNRALFMKNDMFKANFSHYDNVVVFGVPDLMSPLKTKLQQELRSDAYVVACRFPFPDCTPSKTIDEGIESCWLYDRNSILDSGSRKKQD